MGPPSPRRSSASAANGRQDERRQEMNIKNNNTGGVAMKKSMAHPPQFKNADLVRKAALIAEQISKFSFVQAVALFGSAARGEDGNDIDLIIFDNGLVSMFALSNLETYKANNNEDYSSGDYANICYIAFMEKFSETDKLDYPLCEELCNLPGVDLIFVDARIRYNQNYLDRLSVSLSDPLFFLNISRDSKLFYRDKGLFQKNDAFPKFVNNGFPSSKILKQTDAALSAAVPKNQNIGFDAIGGQDKAKNEIMNLSSALISPESYKKWGTRPLRGVCLCGPPGNGKTLLAKALADNVKAPFYPVKSSEIISMWLGESDKNVDNLFAKARKTGGIIFIDEADALVPSRSSYDMSNAIKRIVDAFCRNMDGFEASDNVIVFFATNRLQDMDSAIMRPGRIDKIIEVPLPDREGRKEIFEIHAKKAEEIAGRQLFEPLDTGSSDIAEFVSIAEKAVSGASLQVVALADPYGY
ncbi:MAG: AAA family ATPase, partial [Candidatus Nealsonbacteria bacterium]|nr:AAA family ATPase [Candidatus Nealsonbacteria bacterium]